MIDPKSSLKPFTRFIEGIGEVTEYPIELIVPIPAKCHKCGFDWVGRDAISAPSLSNCRCFWCGGELRPHKTGIPSQATMSLNQSIADNGMSAAYHGRRQMRAAIRAIPKTKQGDLGL